ncbi:MAG: hypothetical protein KGR47_12380, partial [Acidobacteria bacterium]|nr:hypothetical protein [Acidobacteriota bacterium]
MKRVLVGVVGLAVMAAAMPAAGMISAARADESGVSARSAQVRDAVPARGVEAVGPLPVRSDTTPAVTALPDAVAVVPGGRVINPRTPLLHVPARADDAEVGVRIFDVSAGQSPAAESAWTWQGTLRKGWVRIDEDLTPGHGYLVSGYKADEGEWVNLGSFTVSAAGRRGGPTTDVGGMGVSLLTGEVRWNWQSETLVGPSDGVGLA